LSVDGMRTKCRAKRKEVAIVRIVRVRGCKERYDVIRNSRGTTHPLCHVPEYHKFADRGM